MHITYQSQALLENDTQECEYLFQKVILSSLNSKKKIVEE